MKRFKWQSWKRGRVHMVITLLRVYRRWRKGDNPHLRLGQMIVSRRGDSFYREDKDQ